jgi:hypothetical protein
MIGASEFLNSDLAPWAIVRRTIAHGADLSEFQRRSATLKLAHGERYKIELTNEFLNQWQIHFNSICLDRPLCRLWQVFPIVDY